MDEKTDKLLVSEYLAGDEKALGELIALYLKPVYNFVYHIARNAEDTEDITQETFVKAWRNLKRYDQRQNFKTWLFTIARNTPLFIEKKLFARINECKSVPIFSWVSHQRWRFISTAMINQRWQRKVHFHFSIK